MAWVNTLAPWFQNRWCRKLQLPLHHHVCFWHEHKTTSVTRFDQIKRQTILSEWNHFCLAAACFIAFATRFLSLNHDWYWVAWSKNPWYCAMSSTWSTVSLCTSLYSTVRQSLWLWRAFTRSADISRPSMAMQRVRASSASLSLRGRWNGLDNLGKSSKLSLWRLNKCSKKLAIDIFIFTI